MIGDTFVRGLRESKKRGALVAGGIAVAIGLVAVGGGISYAAGGGLAPPPVNPATIHVASAQPDRVILTPTATPAESQNVSWRTSIDVTSPQLQLAEMVNGPVTLSKTVQAVSTTEFATDLGYTIKYHTATITELDPATTYLYRVGDGETWSEWFEFATAADGPAPFSFIVQGDAQNDVKSYASRAFREAFEARPYAKVVVHLGDLIDTDVADAEWGEWFGAAGFQNAYMNVIATPGNHEYYPGPELTRYWKAQFEYPENGPAATPDQQAMFSENTYYVDYQGVRFVSLNSSRQGGGGLDAQAAWLDAILTDNPNKWTVVSFHHPVFSVTSGRDNNLLRDAWLPIFEAHDVDLVLQGHDHAYGRGNLFANETDLPEGADAETSHTGPVYLVSVAGPKMYVPDDLATNNWITNGANLRSMNRDTQMYQIVDVTGDELHVESYQVTGELFDSFTIAKADDGTKLVTDVTEPRASGPGSDRSDTETPAIPTPEVPGTTPTPTPTPTPEPTSTPEPTPTPEPTSTPEPTPEPTSTPEPTTPPTEVNPTPIELSATGVAAGNEISMKGSGFLPNEDLEVTLYSEPIILGYPSADAGGGYFFTARIPAGVQPGEHRIEIVGLESGATVETGITILAAGSPDTGVRDLANTGLNVVGPIVMIGGAALLAGLLAVLLTDRKRRRDAEGQA